MVGVRTVFIYQTFLMDNKNNLLILELTNRLRLCNHLTMYSNLSCLQITIKSRIRDTACMKTIFTHRISSKRRCQTLRTFHYFKDYISSQKLLKIHKLKDNGKYRISFPIGDLILVITRKVSRTDYRFKPQGWRIFHKALVLKSVLPRSQRIHYRLFRMISLKNRFPPGKGRKELTLIMQKTFPILMMLEKMKSKVRSLTSIREVLIQL